MGPLDSGEVLLRLVIAALAGMAIGLEREYREKAAGFRTLALVSTGTAVFVLASILLAPNDSVRMAAGIATGVGFLGAGVILREAGEVVGLTTAAAVWMSAALGVSSAAGAYVLTLAGAGLTLFVLVALPLINLEQVRIETRTFEIVYREAGWDEISASRHLTDAGLRVAVTAVSSSDSGTTALWHAIGRRDRHEQAARALLEDNAIASFTMRA